MRRALLGALALAALASVSARAQEAREREDTEDVRGRYRWEYERRAFPGTEIPPGARLKALRQLDTLRRGPAPLVVEGLPGNWAPIGPRPIQDGQLAFYDTARGDFVRGDVSGRVLSIAVDPTKPSHWAAGTADGGVWQTTDSGGTWFNTPASDAAESLAIGAVAFSADGRVLYAGTGEPTTNVDAYDGVGLLRSTNGGTSWTLAGNNQLVNTRFGALLVDPANSAHLRAAVFVNQRGANSGFVVSSNSGDLWTVERPGLATDLAADPTSSFTRFYGAMGYGSAGVFRFTGTWTQVPDPWPAGSAPGRVVLAIAPSRPQRVYVSASDSNHRDELLGLWFTDNAWEPDPTHVTWTRVNTSATDDGQLGYCRGQCWYDNVLLVDANDPDTLYAGGISLWKCTQCSTAPSWADIGILGASIHADQHALVQTKKETGALDFLKLYNFTQWCDGADKGGGSLLTEPAPLAFTLPPTTPCDAKRFGSATGTVVLDLSPTKLSGTLNESTNRLVLDTPLTLKLTANLTWTAGEHPLPNCAEIEDGCFHASLHAERYGDPLSDKCEADQGSVNVLPGGSTTLSVSITCPVNSLDRSSSIDAVAYLNRYNGFSFERVVTVNLKAYFGSKSETRLVVGNDGGVFSTADDRTWSNHNRTLAITQFFGGAVHPALADVALGGSQDNGTERRAAAADAWGQVVGGDGGDTVISTSVPARQAATVVGNNRIARTLDDWTSQASVRNGFGPCDAQGNCAVDLPFRMRMTKCPDDDDVVLTGSADHKRAAGGGAQPAVVYRNDHFFTGADPAWVANMPAGTAFDRDISALAFAPGTGCQTYAAASESNAGPNNSPDIRITTDGGAHWRPIANPPIPNRSVSALAFSRTNPNVLWVVLQGYDSATRLAGHIFRTDNALDPTPVFANLTPRDNLNVFVDAQANALLLDPSNPGVVYVGTDTGVLRSLDNGARWTAMGPEVGMPHVGVYAIETSPTGQIVAFTHGRGAFRLVKKVADLSIEKSSLPEVNVGDEFEYALLVKNAGPDEANDVVVMDTLPAEMAFVRVTTPRGTCTGTGPVVCRLGTLVKGDSVLVNLTVRATKAGDYTNRATVTSAAVDPKTADNTDFATTKVKDDAADLSIVKTHTPEPVTVKEELTFTLTVTNNGPNDAKDVVVTDTLPAELEFVSAASSPGSCSGTSTVTCTIGDLKKGAHASVVITVKTTKAGTFSNTGKVTGKPRDPNPANDTATDTVHVVESDLEVEKTVSPNPAMVGEPVTFHVTVTNHGPDRARDVTVTDYLFPELTLVSAEATQGSCGGTPTVVCSLGEIANGADVRITIVVKPQKAGRFCNTADVTARWYDPHAENNSSTACVDVGAPDGRRADRSVTKTHTPEPAVVGGRITWTVLVRNAGPDLATGTEVVDVLPFSITEVAASASQGSCSGAPAITCVLGSIAAGGTATITITGKATQEGLFANQATVLGNETDPNGGNDFVRDPFRVVVAPVVTKLTPDSAKQGTRTLDVKIEGANFKPGAVVSFQPSAGIELVTPGPPGFGYVSPVELHQVINLAPGAAIGERLVTVTNPDGLSGGVRPFNVFTVTPGAFGTISLSPSSLDFGPVTVKQTKDRTLTIRNAGTGPLAVRAIGVAPPFAIVGSATPFELAAGAQRDVTVRFAPATAGAASAVVVVSSNDGAHPSATVAVSGTATSPPSLDLSPAALNFGSVAAGQSRVLTVKLRNKGNATLTVSSIAADSARFAASLVTPASLAPGAEQSFDVTFFPSATGVQTGKLTLASNDPEQPAVAMQVRGTGASAPASETLTTDDGSIESGTYADGLIVVNRLTPAAYPAKLTKVSVFVYPFQNFPSPSGATIRLIAYADASGSAASSQHPQILLNQSVTIPQVPPAGAFLDFDVASGPTIAAGDLYVGFAAPNPTGGVIFAADTNGPQKQRGFFSTDGGSTFVGPLVIQGQSGNVPANIMIRATTASGSPPSPCTWGIAPAKIALPKEGGSGTIEVTAPDGCPWTVTSDAGFVTFETARRQPLASGTGSGTVRYSVAPSTTERTAKITIADLDSSVAQTSAAAAPSAFGGDVFVPIVLSTAGLNGSFFTSELTLTNRGATSAVIQARYTAAFGGGGGAAYDVLAPGAQRVFPDGLSYLKSIGTPIPDSGNRGGTVTLSMSGLSSAAAGAATVRTTTSVAEGRAGLAYAGVPRAAALTGTVYLLGLRQNATDRSNVALLNAGTSGDVVLRATVISGDPAAPIRATLNDISLPPGGFNQITGILGSNGLSLTNGYVKVEKVGGNGVFYAYGVINDQANSDGSFVPPVAPESLAGKTSLTVPVIVETSTFLSELVVANFGAQRKTARLTLAADAIAGGSASFTLDLAAGQQLIVPSLVQYLREHGVAGVPAAGTTVAGPLFVSAESGDVSGLFVGARTSSAGGGGRYGLFYTGVPAGSGAKSSAWIFGLQQNAENRTNLAFVNTGEVDGSTDGFRLDLYDGDTGRLVKSVDGISLPARKWTQITTVLQVHAPGVTNAYAKVTRTAGNNPFVAYAVINDGGAPGQRSGDGAFLPMSSVDEE